MNNQIDKVQHGYAVAIANGCPIDELPESLPAKTILFGRLARDVLSRVSQEAIADSLKASRSSTVTGIVSTLRMALQDQVARALHAADEGALDELNVQRFKDRGCPATGVTRSSLITGADAGIFAEGTTLHTIHQAVTARRAEVTRTGIYASARVPKAQARRSLAGLERSWARLAVPLDNPGPNDNTSRAIRPDAYSVHPVRGLLLHDATPKPTVTDSEDPQLGCPALLVPGELVRGLHEKAAAELMRRGIIVPAKY